MNGRKPKLSCDCITTLRRMYREGESKRELGRRFGVDPMTVARYLRGWHKHPEVTAVPL